MASFRFSGVLSPREHLPWEAPAHGITPQAPRYLRPPDSSQVEVGALAVTAATTVTWALR